MNITQTQRGRQQRGSALLLTILITLVGAVFLGLAVDATALLWVRSHAQTTANLVAATVALEQQHNPAAPLPFLVESARATAARNGFVHGVDSVAVHLEQLDGSTNILLERDAGVFFLRMIRPQPVAIRARASVALSPAESKVPITALRTTAPRPPVAPPLPGMDFPAPARPAKPGGTE